MTINLPPRRELPADIKERMRPAFTDQSTQSRRNHTPLAVAAGVALLIAGGVAVTQSITDTDVDPARGRVSTPSVLDIARCRTALDDQNWSSNDMVVFEGRKVLVGKDSRFCELTRTRAYVVPTASAPVQLEAGTITYRSEKIIAGIPPLGALKARARETTSNYSRSSSDAVVTPDFFIAFLPTMLTVTELVFDDRTVPVSLDVPLPRAATSDSFERDNGDRNSDENRLARCLENSAPNSPEASEPGWSPILIGYSSTDTGSVIVARQDRDKSRYGICHALDSGMGSFSTRELTGDPVGIGLLGIYGSGGRQLVAGHTNRGAGTIELSVPESSPVTVAVVDGFFAADIPSTTKITDIATPLPLTAVVRDKDNSVLYSGRIH